MIDLYTFGTPNGRKVTIMLEEVGLEYTPHIINIAEDEQFAPDFVKILPNSKIPAIVDHDTGISLMESGAILMYLAEKTGKLWPQDFEDRWRVTEWLMWQMGGVGPMAGQAHHFLAYAPQMDPPHVLPYAQGRYRAEVARLYGVLDRRLEGSDYICDEFSIADMAVWPWSSLWERQEQKIEEFPNMAKWLERCEARDGVAKGRAVAAELRSDATSKEAQKNLFKTRN